MTHKVGFMGTHSGGKTTAAAITYGELKLLDKNVYLVQETAREAAARGMPLDSTTTLSTQLWILTRQIIEEVEAERYKADFILTDRTVYDALAYNRLYLSQELYDSMKSIAVAYGKQRPYDLIFVFPPLPRAPIADGVRDASVESQLRVAKAFEEVLDELKLPNTYIIKSTAKRARAAECLEVIKERFL